jgi:hypothetical protein
LGFKRPVPVRVRPSAISGHGAWLNAPPPIKIVAFEEEEFEDKSS